ncbi:MAG: F0F1 ATP synthase subunit A [Gemmatimonadota bacterium]|nr:F0F1 ATP synthase subunit A [Gemmatimonadota bacterium]
MADLLYAATEGAHAAAEHGAHQAESGHDAAAIMQHLIEHVYDYPVVHIGWHPFGLEWLDLSITKLTIMMWISAALIFILFRALAASQRKKQTSGRYINFLEPFVLYVRDEMVYPIMGDKFGRKYLPFFLTQFFFILFANLLGMIPGMATATGNLAVCATLACTTLFAILVMGMVEQGLFTFWKNLVPPGMPVWLIPLLFPIEVISIFIKCFALTIRLFANMTAGHIVILTFIGLIFIFHSYLVAVPSIGFALFIYVLELFVAFLQAFIFTTLSIIFINMAIHPEH